MSITLAVPARFRGPVNSAQSGYAAGLLAAWVRGPTEVVMVQPAPLEKTLRVELGTPLTAWRKELLVMEARPAAVSIEIPEPLPFQVARHRTSHFVGHYTHLAPECFCCGTRREKGDGLRIFPGRVDAGEPVAAHWVPHPSLSTGTSELAEPIIWAALECPGYHAIAAPGEALLLSKLTVRVEGRLRVSERCVLMGWSMGRQGRDRYAGTALFGQKGRLIAASKQTWATVR